MFEWLLGKPKVSVKPAARAPRGYSLHTGLNSVDPRMYDGWSGPLNACENDAKHMAHLCESRGFITQVLLTKSATSRNFFAGISTLANVALPGDLVVISNSSHGSQVRDYDGDEADSMDETICLYDRQVLDDELEAAWATFLPGVRIFWVSDSCHSGTMARAFGESAVLLARGSKAVPPDVASRTNEEHASMYRAVQNAVADRRPVRAHVLAYGACQDSQTAMDGPVNGAFTGALLKALAEHPKDNAGRIMTRVQRAMLPSQTPKYVFYGPRLDSFEKSPAFSL